MNTLEIAFRDEAGDSFDQMINQMEGYTVKVFPDTDPHNEVGPEHQPFDAVLVGVDRDASWHGALLVRRIVKGDYDEPLPTEPMFVKRIEVY